MVLLFAIMQRSQVFAYSLNSVIKLEEILADLSKKSNQQCVSGELDGLFKLYWEHTKERSPAEALLDFQAGAFSYLNILLCTHGTSDAL